MKVILLKDVPKIGRKYEIKEVSDGYAINFLIPGKLAEAATAQKVAVIEKMRKGIEIEKNMEVEALNKNLAAISGLELVLKGKASETGHLFSGIRKEDIIAKMKKDYNVEISPDLLVLDKPIKEIGEYSINLQNKAARQSKKTAFKLIVEKE